MSDVAPCSGHESLIGNFEDTCLEKWLIFVA